ncbi:MAG TPA: hypothetical protein VHJ17_03380 [Thermomonospora sp.]|nr:hypothetical protein [Thermomonospora sp.]
MTDQPHDAVPPEAGRAPLPYDEARCEELTVRLGRILARLAPEGWRRIDLKILMLAGVSDLALTVILQNGESPEVEPARELTEIAAELRSRMYVPGRGTWFGLRYLMDAPGSYWVSYNTDFDPLWDPPLPPETYAGDLAAFPREEPHLPGWLRERLQQVPGGAR